MKKFTVVLLIAVLAMTSVFADAGIAFSGTATADYKVNLDAKSFGYTAAQPTYSATFTLAGSTAGLSASGAKLLTAEAAASLTWTATENTATGFSPDAVGKFAIALDSFCVKYGDLWVLNLLKAKAVGNYAVSTLDFLKGSDSKGDAATFAYDDAYAYSTNASKGVTFTWNDFTFAAAAFGDIDEEESSDFYLGMETPNFGATKVAENLKGFSVKGAAAFNYEGSVACAVDSWKLVGSVDAKYTSPVMTYEIKADNAVTFGYKKNDSALLPATKEAAKARYDVDALFTANFTPVAEKADFAALTVYFAKNAYAADYTKEENNNFKNLLSAKVNFDLNCWKAPVAVEVKALNLLNDAKIFGASATYSWKYADETTQHYIKVYGEDLLNDATFYAANYDADKYYKDNFGGQKVGVTAGLEFGKGKNADRHIVDVTLNDYFRIATKDLGASAQVDYTYYYFTVSSKVEGEVNVAKANKSVALKDKALLKVTASVESENVIENATVSLTYKSGNLLGEYDVTKDYSSRQYTTDVAAGLGTVTAALAVEF